MNDSTAQPETTPISATGIRGLDDILFGMRSRASSCFSATLTAGCDQPGDNSHA